MQDNQLIKIENPFQPFNRKCQPIPFQVGRTVGDIVALSGFGDSVVVLLNGNIIDRMDRVVLPGDIIHVYPQLHNDTTARTIGMIGIAIIASFVVGPAVSGAMQGAGWSASAAGMGGSIAAMATVTAGGMLLNGGLAAGNIRQAQRFEESPTYHWDINENPAREGHAIPVVYGQASSYPTIINQWIEIDNDTGVQWAHTTLCVAEGLTNNMPTVNEIYVGDQPLSLYPTDDFTLVTTDGGPSPDWTGGGDFIVPHQTRKIDRQLKQATLSDVMLHCNGTNGSTDIPDSATNETNTWTCQATAALSTAHPWQGTASLNLETNGDYISCDNYDAFNIWTVDYWTIEFQFRQDTLTDSAIMGQQRIDGGTEYYWAVSYRQSDNAIIFQQYKVVGGSTYTVYYVFSQAATGLTTGTWYHFCLQKADDTIYAFGNGALLGSASSVVTNPVAPASGTWAQAVGKGQHKDGVTDTTWYGNCELDEIRIVKNGNAYPLEAFTPPTAELVNPNELIYKTKAKIDKFSVTILAPYGLFWTKNDGSLDNEYVQFYVSYREYGDSAWTRDYKLFYGKTRNPFRQQWEYTMPSRAQYEISISRITTDNITYDGLSTERSQSTTMLSYIDEILDVSLTYPYLQCVGISLKAQDEFSGMVPQFRIVSERTSISVPSFDDTGTQVVNPTDNSFAAFDILTNDVYGGGIDPNLIVEDDWGTWSDWVTATVNGYQRCQINAIFDGASTLDSALQQAENCGRARIVRRGSYISVNVDKPSTAQALFGMGNIVPGSDHVRWIRQAERADATEIVFRDIDLDFAENSATHYSTNFHSLTRVPRIVRMMIPGINNYEQAKREAIIRQQMNDSIKKELELQSGLEAIPVTTGDVINYQASINSYTGRLPRHLDRSEEYTGTTVYLDQEINLDSSLYSGNCMLMVRDPDDTIQTYTVTGPFNTDTWRVTISASGTFDFLSPYIICRCTGDVYQYKVSVAERSNNLDIKLNALQYDSTAYYNTKYDGGSVAI